MGKNDWGRWVTDYLSFNRKERWAVLVLVLVISVLLVLPRFIPDTEPDLVADDSLAMAAIKSWQRDSVDELPTSRHDSGGSKYKHINELRRNKDFYQPGNYPAEGKLFVFDPNKATPGEWMQLGLKEKTALTIGRFREKGGKFRDADDLYKIYGLPAALADKLKPYVRIDPPDRSPPNSRKTSRETGRAFKRVNINTADSVDLVQLPGIGSKLASRIIRYRENLGGFHQNEQLLEVYGIRDTLLKKLISYLEVDLGAPRQIELNSVSREELLRHPYFRGPFAAAIINYREAHGVFRSIGGSWKNPPGRY